jgi:hypothetical protein
MLAPMNPEPKWPEGYVASLREAGAHEKTIPFCLTSVRDFFARHPGRSRRSLGRAEIEAYLAKVATRNGVNNWQVQQARDALDLYYEQFRGIALEPRPDVPKSQGIASRMVAPSAKSWDATIINPSGLNYDTPVAHVKHIPESNGLFRPIAREAPNPAPVPTHPSTDPVSGVKATNSVNWPVLDARVRECLRLEHYSYRTEQTYVGWIRRFVIFHGWRKPSTL